MLGHSALCVEVLYGQALCDTADLHCVGESALCSGLKSDLGLVGQFGFYFSLDVTLDMFD